MAKKIIDSFIFYRELNLLNMRLHELNDEVDYFILVESRKDFRNEKKDLHYEQNKDKFSKFGDKIIHVIVDELPQSPKVMYDPSGTLIEDINEEYGMWLREHFLRNKIMEGVNRLELSDEDIVIISNVDEIPDPKDLRALREKPTDKKAKTVVHKHFYYNFSHHVGNWRGSIVVPFSLLRLRPPQWFKIRWSLFGKIRGGWHCAFFGISELVFDLIETSPWFPALYHNVGINDPDDTDDEKGLPSDKETVESRILLFQDVLGRKGRIDERPELKRVSHEDLPHHKDLLYNDV